VQWFWPFFRSRPWCTRRTWRSTKLRKSEQGSNTSPREKITFCKIFKMAYLHQEGTCEARD
jgi:hypothetical protein